MMGRKAGLITITMGAPCPAAAIQREIEVIYKTDKTALYLATAAAALMACPTIARAQAQPAPAAQEVGEDEDQIVVTGTLIRGVEVTGAQTISVDTDDIIESGASTTMELLGTIPQISSFNSRIDNDPRTGDRLQISRPSLRNLPGVNSATGSTTLLLIDGHRMVPMGVDQASFDPDFIPPGALQGVEVVTDGGSSLYGADAVGGVINFITRRNFEGIEVSGGYDVGDSYSAWTGSATAGLGWNGGGAFVSYNYYHRDNVMNIDRDYSNVGIWNAAGTVLSPSGSECISPVGSASTYVYFAPFNVWSTNSQLGGSVVPVGTACDIEGQKSLLPELERHSVLAGLQHEFSDSLSLDLKANYGESQVTFSNFPLGATRSPPAPTGVGTPFERRVVNAVGFSYGANSAYIQRDQTINLQVFGVTPELTADLGGEWQLKTTGYYGESESSRVLPVSNRIKMEAYAASGALIPLNVAAASAAVINDILNFEVAGDANQSLLLGRAVLDGPLFELPAGELRVAVGVEYNRDRAALRSGSYARGALANQPFRVATRNVKSAFGELSIPVFSMLDLSASGRFDDYSDFGSTFNPSVGFNFKPFEQIRFYGHWNQSYNAPTALDSVRRANASFFANTSAIVPDPFGERTATPNRNDALLLEGSGGGLEPQTAETWAGGVEFEPVDNLVFGGSYYDIDFRNLLSSVNPTSESAVRLNPERFISNPTQAQFNAYLALVENGAQFTNINVNDVGIIIDRRAANIGAARLKGLDFFARYQFDTSFGNISAGVSGNKQISFDATDNGNVQDILLFDTSDFAMSANVGLETGGFRVRATVNHTGGFATNTAVAQTEVDGFTVADLFLGYEFGENSGVFEGLSLRVNVDNVFDTDPPVWRRSQGVNYSGFTLGRIFKLGVSKKF